MNSYIICTRYGLRFVGCEQLSIYTPARGVAAGHPVDPEKAVSKMKLKFRTPPSSKLKFKGGFELLSASLS